MNPVGDGAHCNVGECVFVFLQKLHHVSNVRGANVFRRFRQILHLARELCNGANASADPPNISLFSQLDVGFFKPLLNSVLDFVALLLRRQNARNHLRICRNAPHHQALHLDATLAKLRYLARTSPEVNQHPFCDIRSIKCSVKPKACLFFPTKKLDFLQDFALYCRHSLLRIFCIS